MSASPQCHICHAHDVEQIDSFSDFYRVTSDCRAWKRGGKLGVCRSCGSAQKVVDQDFQSECCTIYDSYSVYHQAQGKEQMVFEQTDGLHNARSKTLLSKLLEQFAFPQKGRLLDVGCGNGNLLRYFSRYCPSWTLSGSELNDKYRSIVESIDNVEALYTCHLMEIPGRFDMISLIHCLEHIEHPINFLKTLKQKLKENGYLLIQVPDFTQNPFDLIIADHCSHFDCESLGKILWTAGFEPIIASPNFVPKELSFLVRKSKEKEKNGCLRKNASSLGRITNSLRWLSRTRIEAGRIAGQESGPFGLFGTSIAATWLCNELDDAVTFFADEDPNRIGNYFMGRKVYHPKDIQDGSSVFLAFPLPIAKKIQARMTSFHGKYFLPPDFEENP